MTNLRKRLPSGHHHFLTEWFLLLGGLALVGVLVGLSLFRGYTDIGQSERDRLTTQASVINRNLGLALHVVDRALLGIREDWPAWRRMPGGMSQASQQLRAFSSAMRSVRSLFVLDADGRVVASSRPELLGRDLGTHEYFQKTRAQASPEVLYLVPPQPTPSGDWAMHVARVIPGTGGKISGVVVATIDPDEIRAQLSAVLYSADMWAAVAHGNGLQVVMEPDRSGQSGLNLALPGSFFSRHMESGLPAQVFEGAVTANGTHRLVAMQTIRPPDVPMDTPLIVTVGREMGALYAHWRRQAWLEMGLFVLLGGLSLPGLAFVQRSRRREAERQAKAGEELARSEHFLRTVVDIIPGMVGYWNRDLRCQFANSAYLEWFGRTREQMFGIRIQDLMGEELFSKNEPYIRAALAGERQSFERTLVKADGSTGYTWAHYIPDVREGAVQGFFVLVSDITDLKRSEMALRENRQFLEDLIEYSGNLIFAKDKEGRYLLANRMYEQTTGFARVALLGHTDFELRPHETALALRADDLAVMESGAAKHYEEAVGAKHFLTTKFPLRDANGQVNGVCGIAADITEQKGIQREMERLANTDALTLLANRRHFLKLAEIEISRGKRFGYPLSLLMLDIDHFKSINDTYGHPVGDEVIASVGELFRQKLRDIDIAGRLGGEEFAILLPNTPAEFARDVAERLRRDFAENPITLAAGHALHCTVSIGCATSPDCHLDEAQLMKLADQRLYEAKHAGRNRVVA